MSGWYIEEDGDDKNIYYLGDENEGYAHTEWQYLEPDEEDTSSVDPAYESQEWFYFQSSGKAYVGTTKYINNSYYTFDAHGVLEDEWLPRESMASSATPEVPNFHDVNGVKTGWVYGATKNDPDTYKWYYIVNTSNGKLQAFGSNSKLWEVEATNKNDATDTVDDVATKTYTAKSINGKTYIFNAYGEMQDGLVEIKNYKQYSNGKTAATWQGVAAKELYVGEKYYFSKADASQGTDGRMVKGKVTHEDNGDTSYYYFDKSFGYALKNQIKDHVLYGPTGARIQAEDGMSMCTVKIGETFGTNGLVVKGIRYYGGTLIVTSSGKVKESGTFTIDDIKYHVDAATGLVDQAYEKDAKKPYPNRTNLYEAKSTTKPAK